MAGLDILAVHPGFLRFFPRVGVLNMCSASSEQKSATACSSAKKSPAYMCERPLTSAVTQLAEDYHTKTEPSEGVARIMDM